MTTKRVEFRSLSLVTAGQGKARLMLMLMRLQISPDLGRMQRRALASAASHDSLAYLEAPRGRENRGFGCPCAVDRGEASLGVAAKQVSGSACLLAQVPVPGDDQDPALSEPPRALAMHR